MYFVLIPLVTERSALFERNFHSHRRRQLMMPFSTGIGLERVGVVGLGLELPLGWFVGSERWTPLQKQKTKMIGGGSPVASPMPKSVLP